HVAHLGRHAVGDVVATDGLVGLLPVAVDPDVVVGGGDVGFGDARCLHGGDDGIHALGSFGLGGAEIFVVHVYAEGHQAGIRHDRDLAVPADGNPPGTLVVLGGHR